MISGTAFKSPCLRTGCIIIVARSITETDVHIVCYRCIIWERKHGVATAQQSCEGADDSEVEAPSAASRSHPQHAPLLVRNRTPSCMSDCIQLVGARKRAASTAGIGSPLKAARESSSLGGTCTVADLHEMLFGQVQSVQFAVPLY